MLEWVKEKTRFSSAYATSLYRCSRACGDRGRSGADNRAFVNGVLWVLRSGVEPTDADAVATVIAKIFKALPASGLKSLNLPSTSSKKDILKYITTPSDYTRGYVNHWSGSCKIGECVDSNTKVFGTDNLHVVDSSITEAFTTNPMFGIVAVAERASELILALDKK